MSFLGAFSSDSKTESTNTDRKLTADSASSILNISDLGKKSAVNLSVQSLDADIAKSALDGANSTVKELVGLSTRTLQSAESFADSSKNFTEGLKDIVTLNKSGNVELTNSVKLALGAAVVLGLGFAVVKYRRG